MGKPFGNILIIDDEPLILMNYADILEDAGYGTTTAENSTQAWNILKSREFELIICDHDLGDGKGIDLIRKNLAEGRMTPVLYLSAAQPQILEEVAKVFSIRKVLTKPVPRELLLENVKAFVMEPEPEDPFHRLIGTDERRMLLDDNPLFRKE